MANKLEHSYTTTKYDVKVDKERFIDVKSQLQRRYPSPLISHSSTLIKMKYDDTAKIRAVKRVPNTDQVSQQVTKNQSQSQSQSQSQNKSKPSPKPVNSQVNKPQSTNQSNANNSIRSLLT